MLTVPPWEAPAWRAPSLQARLCPLPQEPLPAFLGSSFFQVTAPAVAAYPTDPLGGSGYVLPDYPPNAAMPKRPIPHHTCGRRFCSATNERVKHDLLVRYFYLILWLKRLKGLANKKSPTLPTALGSNLDSPQSAVVRRIRSPPQTRRKMRSRC